MIVFPLFDCLAQTNPMIVVPFFDYLLPTNPNPMIVILFFGIRATFA
jgi:hypothetical protein